jgi:hypothetical protein
MRKIAAVAAALALGAVILVANANAWYSNVWRSPSRNIACRYYAQRYTVLCETENDAFAVAVGRYSGRAYRTHYSSIPYRVPILPYGTFWSADGIRCVSRSTGMTCRTPAGHGFFLERHTYNLW